MEPYRIYIDESGDHAYKNFTEHDYEKRYLGLTGVLIQTAEYVNRSLTRFSGQFTCRHHAASAAAAGLLSYSTGLRSPIEV